MKPMNTHYTLKELADIGAKAANLCLPDNIRMSVSNGGPHHHVVAREAFTKAILDAIGYEFPKDEEREAFDAWCKASHGLATTNGFEAWKAGREELRKEIGSEKCRNTKTEPAWIPWTGGSKSPINGLQTRCEIQCRDGTRHISDHNIFRWSHSNTPGDILAYRIIEP